MRYHVRGADQGRVGVRGLRERVSRCGLVPMRILAAYRCRPHQIEHRCEVDHDVYAVTAFHRISEENGRFVERYKESFPDDEIGAYIGAGNRFRFVGYSTKQSGPIDFGRVSRGTETQFISADQLQWIGPG